MKQLPLIAGQLYCQPWSILPSAHASLCKQFRAHIEAKGNEETGGRTTIEMKEPASAADDPVGPGWRDDESGQVGYWHRQVEVYGSLAILPVHGVIGKHLSTLAMWCGGVDGALLTKQAQNIANDPNIQTVIVHVRSPGGACVGAIETARAILGMAEAGKVTIAYTDTQAASNGYLFASACDEIWAAPSAIVGSISTFCAYLDESRAYEMEGLEVRMFRTGDVKGVGYPGKPWTEEEKASQQLVTDQFGEQFKGFVRGRRGLGEDLMQGQFWPGEFAPPGVIDGLADDLQTLVAAVMR